MKAFVSTTLLLLLFFTIHSVSKLSVKEDPRIDWLKTNAVKIKSVEPADEDFSDLEPLKNIIGDSVRLVMFGEQSHGDGTTFLAKTRMIKFLHERMGFDVLAFESNMYDCQKAQDNIDSGKDYVKEFNEAVFGIWTLSNEAQPLACYLEEKNRSSNPLKITGFDYQYYSFKEREEINKILQNFLKQLTENKIITIPDTLLRDFKNILFDIQKDKYFSNKDEFDSISKLIINERDNTAAIKLFGDKTSYNFRLFEDYYKHKEYYYLRYGIPLSYTDSTISYRDIQMGENLLWYLKNNPDKKVIVWAATFHIIRNVQTIVFPGSDSLYAGVKTMGDIVYKGMGRKSYVIGFTAYEGFVGRVGTQPYKLEKVNPTGLEYLFNEAGLENAFVGFRKSELPENRWLKEKIVSRPLGYLDMYADWTDKMDAIIYTRKMVPSTL